MFQKNHAWAYNKILIPCPFYEKYVFEILKIDEFVCSGTFYSVIPTLIPKIGTTY